MPTSPRDVDAYLVALGQTIERIAPNIDVNKGPLAVLSYAAAVEGSRTEVLASYLQRLYQLSDPSQIMDDDLFELALNFGKDPNVAKLAQGIVFFYRTTRPEPDQIYRAEIGTIVSTSDGRFNYSVIEANEMNGNIADAYFNSSTGRYELPVLVEAQAAGTDYNLPPNTITSIQTFQDYFDGCVNRDYMRNGDDPPDAYQVRSILWNAMQGLNSNITGQVNRVIASIAPTGVDEFSIVSSTDYINFERLSRVTGKYGYDIYLITSNVLTHIYRGTANGGEMSLPLERKPVLSIQYVAIDGVQVPFSFNQDQAPEHRLSPLANDTVSLSVPLQPGQTWEIAYQYYNLVYEIHTAMQGRIRLFDSDVLVRSARAVDIYIAGEVRTFSTVDEGDVISSLRAYTQGYLRNPDDPAISYQTFVQVLDPYDYQRAVEASIDGLQQFRLTRFVRLDHATLPIERITLNGKTEYPTLAINFDVT